MVTIVILRTVITLKMQMTMQLTAIITMFRVIITSKTVMMMMMVKMKMMMIIIIILIRMNQGI